MSTPTPPRRRRIAGERRRPQDENAPVTESAPEAAPAEVVAAPAAPAAAPPPPPPPALEFVEEDAGATAPVAAFPRWRFLAALVAALTFVTTALVLGLVTWDYRQVSEQDRIEDVQLDAAAAAERAAAAVLGFTYETLDADLAAASRFLSPTSYDGNPAFREIYTETFNGDARPRAIETKATVTAKVLATAVVNASEERAQILVYVDQTTVSTVNGGRAQVALNRTTFDMVNEDGSWLVAGITSY